MAAQVGMAVFGLVDTVMVGHLDTQSGAALAAVALGSTFSFGAMILGMGTLHALDPVVSQAHGAGERGAIGVALERGLGLSLLLSLPYLVLFWFAGDLLRALGQPPEIVVIARPFIRALAPGVPAFFAFIAVRQTLQGMGLIRPVLLAVALANLVNVVGNLVLIYGWWGFPAMGAVGSAWSTSLARWVMFGAVALFGAPALGEVWIRPSRALLQLRPYLRLLAIGLPIGIQIGLEMWVFTTAALLIGHMGATQIAGHQIAINLASLSFMVPLGIGAAAATRVGNAIGRGDAPGARLAARVALATGASVMLLSASLFGLFPAELALGYTRDPGVVAVAAQLIPIAALFQIFDGTQAVGCGVLRGAADTRVAAIINFAGYWILGLPVGILLAYPLGLGPRGLWWGLTLGLAIVAALVVARIAVRFRHAIERV